MVYAYIMINELKQKITDSENIVFFGGAGVSTESGIPDFRSEAGLYSALKQFYASPEELLSHSFFMRKPDIFFAYYRENLIHQSAKPNAAHLAIARLEAAGKLKAVITQNIDGLHQSAGSKNVFELHGSVHKNYCMNCKKRYPLEFVMAAKSAPKCECGGIVRPDVVLYEESLDWNVMMQAQGAIADADLVIVGGTSLSVYPAAGLLAKYTGELVLINKTPTPYDDYASMVFREPIGEVLGKAVE